MFNFHAYLDSQFLLKKIIMTITLSSEIGQTFISIFPIKMEIEKYDASIVSNQNFIINWRNLVNQKSTFNFWKFAVARKFKLLQQPSSFLVDNE